MWTKNGHFLIICHFCRCTVNLAKNYPIFCCFSQKMTKMQKNEKITKSKNFFEKKFWSLCEEKKSATFVKTWTKMKDLHFLGEQLTFPPLKRELGFCEKIFFYFFQNSLFFLSLFFCFCFFVRILRGFWPIQKKNKKSVRKKQKKVTKKKQNFLEKVNKYFVKKTKFSFKGENIFLKKKRFLNCPF